MMEETMSVFLSISSIWRRSSSSAALAFLRFLSVKLMGSVHADPNRNRNQRFYDFSFHGSRAPIVNAAGKNRQAGICLPACLFFLFIIFIIPDHHEYIF
jgi:hypothetical protein